MDKYQRKPEKVEAFQYVPDEYGRITGQIPEFIQKRLASGEIARITKDGMIFLDIDSISGSLRCDPYDWLVLEYAPYYGLAMSVYSPTEFEVVFEKVI